MATGGVVNIRRDVDVSVIPCFTLYPSHLNILFAPPSSLPSDDAHLPLLLTSALLFQDKFYRYRYDNRFFTCLN